jgi:hypothetical protein
VKNILQRMSRSRDWMLLVRTAFFFSFFYVFQTCYVVDLSLFPLVTKSGRCFWDILTDFFFWTH